MKNTLCILFSFVALASATLTTDDTKKDVENEIENQVPISRFFHDWFHPVLHNAFASSYLDHFLSREENPFLVPNYKMEDDPTKFQVSLNVDKFKKEDINVELKAGGRILSMEGERHESTDGKDEKRMSSKFYHSFVLNPSTEIDKITAQITPEGQLIVTAPKHKQDKMATKKIPITTMKIEYDERRTKME